MESSEQREKTERGAPSVLGAGITITGNVDASVDLHVEGRVNGDVRCDTLIIGEHGVIAGGIHAQRIRVSGTVEGSIDTADIAIEATGRVLGDVRYNRLKVASGAVITGNLQHRSAEEAADGAKLKLVENSEPVRREPIFIE